MATINTGLPHPKKKRVRLSALKTDEATFQPRFHGVMANHVEKLIDVLRRGEELDPMRVWKEPKTGNLIVADGHHRLEAYRQSRSDKSTVTVEIYECGLTTALVIPIAENAKDRLSLSYNEKANRAWKLTVETKMSKARVAAACAISERTVGYQRKVKRQLSEDTELMPDTWKRAMRQAEGRDGSEYSDEQRQEAMEAEIKKADEQIGATLTELFQRWPEAAMALVIRCAGANNFNNAMDDLDLIELSNDPAAIRLIAQKMGEMLEEKEIDNLAQQAKDAVFPY